MKILLTGATGQVGREIGIQGASFGHQIVELNHQNLDIANRSSVSQALTHNQADLVINSAAYTAVDKAEKDVDQAFAVNRQGPENLSLETTASATPIIHISTDYVFDGKAFEPYSENASANPINVYGRSKWQGEESVRKANPSHIILRTSWVYGIYGNNFVHTILRLASEREILNIVSDQLGAPTSGSSIAACVLQICSHIQQGDDIAWGTYHYSGTPETNWYEFANRIVSLGLEYGVLTRPVHISPIPTSDFPTPAKRPRNSRLECGKISKTFGITPRNWQEELETVIKAIAQHKK